MNRSLFPENFHWGASTASYQVEGYNENCDWAEAGKAGQVPLAGRLTDHYYRYEEDFDIAQELGHNAHRLSIEWSRIEPREGEFDEAEVEHYRQVLRALRKRGIEPYVTLWHFTLPLWLSHKGGFEDKAIIEYFSRYCVYVAEQLKDECTHFSTMNEPIVFSSNGWIRGEWPPFKRFAPVDALSTTKRDRIMSNYAARGLGPLFSYRRVALRLIQAHREAYTAIKEVVPEAEVGMVKNVIVFTSNWNPFNWIRARIANYAWTHWFMRGVANHCDEIGVNYYFYHKFGDRTVYPKTDMGWDMCPENIYDALYLLRRYKKPLFVSEAGLADEQDTYRAQYITRQVAGVERALQAGLDVRAHLYWSFMDNYEWAFGIYKRFGLVAVNYETLERTIRPSAFAYKDIIEKAQGKEKRSPSKKRVGTTRRRKG